MRSVWAETIGGPARFGRGLRFFAAAAAAAVALALGGEAPPTPATAAPAPPAYRFAADEGHAPSRRAVARTSWQGGRYLLAGGESVTVFVSQSLAAGRDGRAWAEFLGTLIHGSELSRLEAYFVAEAEVEELCGGPALGCYSNNMMVSIGKTVDGVSGEEVATHEYGHHVAHNRANPPWRAIDYGTKRWATYVGICARAAQGAVFPGDEGKRYQLNPGEGFAEAYRVLNERRRGVAVSQWTIVDRSFYPDDAALALLEADVLRPWMGTSRTDLAGRVGRSRWSKSVSTPLDGDLAVTLRLPRGTNAVLEVVGADGRTLARGQWSAANEQTATYQVCGQRSLGLRVAKRGPVPRFSISVVVP
jgi:hypothetical protein